MYSNFADTFLLSIPLMLTPENTTNTVLTKISSTHPYTLPIRPTSIWPLPSIKKAAVEAFNLPISHVVVNSELTPDSQYFHFTLSLVSSFQCDSGSDSNQVSWTWKPSDVELERPAINLNMSPSYTDNNCPMRGILLVDYKGYVPSTNTPGYTVRIAPGVTAGDICGFLLDRSKMDQYIFNEEGKGCRHWCATALENLEGAGYTADKGIAESFAQDEADSAVKYGDRYPMPRIRGTFYE